MMLKIPCNNIAVVILFAILFISPLLLFGQEHAQDNTEEEFKHNRLAIMISHTHIPKGIPLINSNGALIVPSWGLNYEYWFNHKWAIGLHSDMEISTYVIEDKEGGTLERTRPLIVSLVGIYNPWQGLEFIAGVGREFEEHENFWVYRFGIEYEIEIGHHWDIAPGLIFDVKEDLYDSWTLGLSVGKRF